MDRSVRPARIKDLDSIEPWTNDTFEWGDYVPHRFSDWLEDPLSNLLVAVDESDVPIALVNARMMSPTEGWLEAARVRPDHQRKGLGTMLNHAGVDWVREQGAKVVRLAIEDDNPAAISQVEKLAYRRSSEWVAGFIDVEPATTCLDSERLRPARPGDVDGAWVLWSTSDLARAGRALLADGWLWRRATVEDFTSASKTQRLVQSQHGWALMRESAPVAETMLLATSPPDLPGLLNGLKQRAAGRVEEMIVRLPALDWSVEALRRAGFYTSGIHVFSKPA